MTLTITNEAETGTNKLCDRPRKPVFIHSDFDDLPLTVEAFRVYGHLARRANDQNVCWPSYRTIGEVCFRGSYPHSSTNTLRRKAITAVQELIAWNLVRVQARTLKGSSARSSNLYIVTDKSSWKSGAVNIKSARRERKHATRGVMVQDSHAVVRVLSQHQGGVARSPGVVLGDALCGGGRTSGVVLGDALCGGGLPPEVVFPQQSGGVARSPEVVRSLCQGGTQVIPEVVLSIGQGGAQVIPEVVLSLCQGGAQETSDVMPRERSGGVAGRPEIVFRELQGSVPGALGVVRGEHQGGVRGAPKGYPIELHPIELSPTPPYPPQGGCERESIEVDELNSEVCGSTQSQETSLLEVKSFSLDLTAPNSLKKEKPIKYDPDYGMRPPRQRPKFMYPDGPWLNHDGTMNGDFIRAQATLWRTGDSPASKAFGAMAIEDVEAKVCGHYMKIQNHAKLEVEWNAYCMRSQRYAANVQARLASGGTVGEDEQKKIVSLIPAIACDIEPVYSAPEVQCPQVPTLMLQSAESTPSAEPTITLTAAPSPIRPIELDLNRVPLEDQMAENAEAYQLFQSQSLPPVSSPPPDFFAKLKTKMSMPAVNSRDRQRSTLDIPAIEQMLKSGGEPTDESEYARQQKAIARRWLSQNGS